MNYNNVQFKASYVKVNQLPEPLHPEVVFCGRSNVGKSTLINALFNRKKLAKVSSTPGKTAAINFFTADDADFVDLPGYGYAAVSKAEKANWARLIEGYLSQDRRFAAVIVLVDIRHEAKQLDRDMISFLMDRGIPFIVVMTKSDKLSKMQASKQEALLRRQFDLGGAVEMIPISSVKGTNINRLKSAINQAIAQA